MIVTADPLGDFNATSQILRYSALAREVTIPRTPSVSSTILSSTTGRAPSGQTSPTFTHTDEAVVEMAFSEIARLSEEVEILNVRLAEEEGRRKEAEENWQNAEDKAEVVEMEVREECWTEMEKRLEEERRRWMGAWGEEVSFPRAIENDVYADSGEQADHNDEHLDRKMEILSKGIKSKKPFPSVIIGTKYKTVHEDPVDQHAYITELQTENEALRQRLEASERELQCRSPTESRQKPRIPSLALTDLRLAAGSGSSIKALGSALSKLNGLELTDPAEARSPKKTPGKTPGKKVRKLTTRKWDLMDENDLDAFENHY